MAHTYCIGMAIFFEETFCSSIHGLMLSLIIFDDNQLVQSNKRHQDPLPSVNPTQIVRHAGSSFARVACVA